MKCVIAAAFILGAAPSAAQPARLDPDTAAWWATSAQLSNDAMEGRDTGSAAYDRAARLVASKFQEAGLKPAGENGTWFQRVPMHEIAITSARLNVGGRPLLFLHDLTVSPARGMPAGIDLPLAYGGYCAPQALRDVSGRIVICHGTH
ncbi:MAG TPA: peptidase M28, partial [Sphingomicrobium sp.]